jgi:hypothetical protein
MEIINGCNIKIRIQIRNAAMKSMKNDGQRVFRETKL